MDIQIIGDNVEITDDMELLIAKKLVLPLDKLMVNFAPDLKQATVKVQQRPRWGYKINLDMMLPGKKHIYAETASDTLMKAVTSLREEVEHQIKHYKDKVTRKNNYTALKHIPGNPDLAQ